MILEALNFAATWAISGRRSASEINASIRLGARARRCSRDWAGHEGNCKAFVRRHMPERGRVAAVLGSGLLRDVPIETLSDAFREVRLYDLQHLASVRLWAAARGLRNLRFLQRDLSEGLGFLSDDPEVDLVISANLLSQLGVAAVLVSGIVAGSIAWENRTTRGESGLKPSQRARATEIPFATMPRRPGRFGGTRAMRLPVPVEASSSSRASSGKGAINEVSVRS